MAVKRVARRDFSVKPKKRSEMNEKEILQDDIHNGDFVMEKILNSKKIRYEILNDLLPKFPSSIDTVTIYIDVLSVYNNLYNPRVLEDVSVFNNRDKFILSSSLINMAAHFRNYFATRKQMYTNIVFFYSFQKSKREVSMYPDFKLDYYAKRITNEDTYRNMNKLFKDNLKLCKIISDYLPHVYFVNTKNVNPFIVPYHFIKDQLPNEVGIIYSNDKLQMLNCLETGKGTMLMTAGFGDVKLYNELDLIDYYAKKEDMDDVINPQLLPYIYAISGYKKYNITGLKGYGEVKTLKLFQKLIKDGHISNIYYSDSDLFMKDITASGKFNDEQLSIIDRNIKLLNPTLIYDSISPADMLSAFETNDLQDIQSLIDINNTYYEFYPLQLEELLIGEEYESV